MLLAVGWPGLWAAGEQRIENSAVGIDAGVRNDRRPQRVTSSFERCSSARSAFSSGVPDRYKRWICVVKPLDGANRDRGRAKQQVRQQRLESPRCVCAYGASRLLVPQPETFTSFGSPSRCPTQSNHRISSRSCQCDEQITRPEGDTGPATADSDSSICK